MKTNIPLDKVVANVMSTPEGKAALLDVFRKYGDLDSIAVKPNQAVAQEASLAMPAYDRRVRLGLELAKELEHSEVRAKVLVNKHGGWQLTGPECELTNEQLDEGYMLLGIVITQDLRNQSLSYIDSIVAMEMASQGRVFASYNLSELKFGEFALYPYTVDGKAFPVVLYHPEECNNTWDVQWENELSRINHKLS
ncbi:hypothetical protein [Vibrio phage YC]|uniref:Uncharacterized protein n=1 Tax=Vibrio phage YC TaxID=2267403 RepID=A0A384ZSD3_9CAUD|nr:hypothetical protein HWB64_gp184 [Vibrio phage YC]AXC34553.1 hypothetical protein [Vibrio phage YC]